MDFNSIEELKEENIISLYNDIIEGNNLSSWVEWYVKCDNGKTGKFIDNYNGRSVRIGWGSVNYNEYCMTTCPKYFNTTCNVCGTGCQRSYITCSANGDGYRCGVRECL